MLGKLLVAAGEPVYMLTHGSGRSVYHLILLPVTETEVEQLTRKTGSPAVVIKLGKHSLTPFPLEKDMVAGAVDAKYYDIGTRRWTATIATMRFQ